MDCGTKVRIWWVDTTTKEGKSMRRTIAVELIAAENQPQGMP